MGLSLVLVVNGVRYFVPSIGDFTRFTWIYILQNKEVVLILSSNPRHLERLSLAQEFNKYNLIGMVGFKLFLLIWENMA